MSIIKPWLKAFRLRTLPLALSSILMGGFLAAYNNVFQWSIFLLCVLTTVFLQVLSNVANDYGDSVHGADSQVRIGPKRAVQSGEITPRAMKIAIAVFVILSLIAGITLLIVAFGFNVNAILFFLLLGLLCIAAAIAYTVGKKPYGYAGLGDFSVLIFFGFVGVLGSFYLFSKTLLPIYTLPAISCGVFAMAVLNINNIRDIESDRIAGKYSIPVRIGRDKAIVYHLILIALGIMAACIFTIATFSSPWQLLFLLSLPVLFQNVRAVRYKPSEQLDPYLRQMALSSLLFVLLFGIGLLL